MTHDNSASPYDLIGGETTIRRLVDAFYKRVIKDPDLQPIFPQAIEPVRDKQYLFLTQFLGGPPLYSAAHGHPMLRARHMPHEITPKRAQAWLACMQGAMDEIQLAGEVRDFIFERLTLTAHHMINRPD